MKVSGYASVMGYTTTSQGAEVMEQAWKIHVSTNRQQTSQLDNGEYGDEEEDQVVVIPNPRLWEHGQDEDLIDETPHEGEPITNTSEHRPRTVASNDSNSAPPLLVVQVPELPRGAPVEWVGIGLDEEYISQRRHRDQDADDSDDSNDRYESSSSSSLNWRIIDAALPGLEPSSHIRTWYLKRVAYGCMVRFGLSTMATLAEVAEFTHRVICNEQNEKGLVPCVVTAYIPGGFRGGGDENPLRGFCERWEEVCGKSELRDLLQVVPVERVWFGGEGVNVGVVARFMNV